MPTRWAGAGALRDTRADVRTAPGASHTVSGKRSRLHDMHERTTICLCPAARQLAHAMASAAIVADRLRTRMRRS